jgi:hypothetical protein
MSLKLRLAAEQSSLSFYGCGETLRTQKKLDGGKTHLPT